MDSSKEITQEQADNAVATTMEWIEKNHAWLTEWLTNVVMITQRAAETSKMPFQTFTYRLQRPPPGGLIEAGYMIKADIIKQSIFGHERKILTPTKPATFEGFISKFGRKPTEKDTALYTAYKWFEFQPGANGVWLSTICTCEFFPAE